MMRIKRKIIKITALILAGILFTGCNAGTKGAEGDKDAKSPITLDWYINFSWFITGWGENLVSKTITDETGVSVNFITPIGSEEEKLNALISSDSLPDIITLGWWEPQVEEMINKGMVYALNELADEYQTDFYEMADENVINWYKQEDGNIYCYPNSSYTPKDVEDNEDIPANLTFLVRKDIYEAIGSPDMTTKEGFYNAIKDAAALYPEIKGEPIIPIGGTTFTESGCASFDQYLQDFLAIPHEVDGKYYDRNMDPEYLDWLKLLRKLNEEGYLPADIFVDQRTQISEKVADGRYFCLIYQRTD
ncbi:MAG: extracellular solute-binding protein, partial [Lachnospiraceae bacterium]|nr:extracellular solute-binding protein [Lachnospiraceae bacterium]